MIFTRLNDWCQVSDCKRYTIVRIGMPKGMLYELWCGKERVMHEGPIAEDDHEARKCAVVRLTDSAERHANRNTENRAA